MHDGIDVEPTEKPVKLCWFADIADNELCFLRHCLPMPLLKIVEDYHLMTGAQESISDHASDVPSSTRDKYSQMQSPQNVDDTS